MTLRGRFSVFATCLMLLLAISPSLGQITINGSGSYATLQDAVTAASAGDVIQMPAGTYPIGAQITINKANLTIQGVGSSSTILQVSGTGERLYITASGVTVQNLQIQKTDKGGVQNIIYVGANNVTIKNNDIHGQFVIGDGDVSRAIIVTGGLSGLLFEGNTIYGLRQPAYISGPTTGNITNNYVYGTKGWVLEGGSMVFTGNTWGSGANTNVYDIAILSLVGAGPYPDIVAMSSANNGAIIEDQRASPAVLSVVYVDASTSYSSDLGGKYHPYSTITPAITRVVSGGTINVAAGTYDEDVALTKSLSLLGAGAATTTIRGIIGGAGSTITVSASNIIIAGFTISRVGNTIADWNNAGLNSAGVAIQGLALTGTIIHDNVLSGNRSAIDINNSLGHTIRNNRITDNRTGVIFRNQTDNITFVENEVTNNWTVGILFLDASGGTNSPVQTALNCSFTNNNISGNWYGQIIDRQSGGALPPPGTTNLKNFGGNWLGTNVPVVSVANSAEPGYAALIPVAYGGTSVPPGGQPDIAGTASANVDFTPYLNAGTETNVETTAGQGTYGFQGDFSNLWVTAASAQTGSVGRIQEAINLVSGSTVNVAAGTYEEQLEITRNLSLIGAGAASTTVKSPATLTKYFMTSVKNYPIVYIHDAAAVQVSSFTIDGAGRGNANYRFQGIGFSNAGGSVNNCTITDIRDTPFSGSQHGVGIYAYNTDGVSRAVTFAGNTITGFQKTGMALNAGDTTPLQVDVHGNQVTGVGATAVTAQNGIQVWALLGSGTVTGNSVSGIAYTGTSWVATSILKYYGNVDITENTITQGHMGIYNIDGTGHLNGNTIGVVKAGPGGWGIEATDPPHAKPSPFGEVGASTGGTQTLQSVRGASSIASTLVVDVSNNNVTFSGADNTSTVGIEADAGYGANDIAFTANSNTVTGFETGIAVTQCTSGCGTGVFTSVSAHSNNLAGNTTGFYSDVSALVADATRNWWGDKSGPKDTKTLPGIPNYNNPSGTGSQVTSYVDYDPWTGKVPAVMTNPASNVTAGDAQLNGLVNPGGVAATYFFEYGPTNAYGMTTPVQSAGSGVADVAASATVTSLSPGTQYHYRAVAQNANGISQGNDVTFTTAASYFSNGEFESGTAPWVFYTNGSGTFDNNVPGPSSAHAGHVTIGSVGTNMQLYLTPITLESGVLYRLSFKAYSSSGNDFLVAIHQHDAPYTSYGLPYQRIDLGNAWSSYSVEFTASGFSGTATDGRLRIWFVGYAVAGDQYYLDDVILEKVVSTGAPAVITTAATAITTTSAQMNGSVNPSGGATTYYFEYGPTAAYGSTTAAQSAGSGTLAVSVNAPWTGLTPGATYHYRLVAQNVTGTSTGSDVNFTTTTQGGTVTSLVKNGGFEEGTLPWTFFTNGAGSYDVDVAGPSTAHAAHLAMVTGGTNIQLYQTNITLESGVRYRLSFKGYSSSGNDVAAAINQHGAPYTGYGLSEVRFDLGTSWASFAVEFVASGFSGTVNDGRLRFWFAPYAAGGDQYFFDDVILEKVVPTGVPTVVTGAASDITTATAQMNGSVNPNGSATTYYFEYGPTTAYGSATVAQSAGSGTSLVAVNSPLTGLTASTVYHYRLVAQNASGMVQGSDVSFTTSASGGTVVSLLVNGGFEEGTAPWTFYTNGSGSFDASAAGPASAHAAHLDIVSAGTNVQLYQAPLTLQAGILYRLSFKAYSSTGNDLSVSLHQHGAPYTIYGLPNQRFDLTTVWASYAVQFTASGFSGTASDGRLRFWFAPYAIGGDQYYIDDIVIEKVTPVAKQGQVVEEASVLPSEPTLRGNFPNPFNPSTLIEFAVPDRMEVEVTVYSAMGQRIATLVNGVWDAGTHHVRWNGSDDHGRLVSSGIYYCRMQTGNGLQTRRMVFLK
jgi:hypothetical protein